jgi:hypothetical protein
MAQKTGSKKQPKPRHPLQNHIPHSFSHSFFHRFSPKIHRFSPKINQFSPKIHRFSPKSMAFHIQILPRYKVLVHSVAAAARYADTQANEAIKPATSTPPRRPGDRAIKLQGDDKC